MIEFTIGFRALVARSKWNAEILCDKYYEGPADRIKDELVGNPIHSESTDYTG